MWQGRGGRGQRGSCRGGLLADPLQRADAVLQRAGAGLERWLEQQAQAQQAQQAQQRVQENGGRTASRSSSGRPFWSSSGWPSRPRRARPA